MEAVVQRLPEGIDAEGVMKWMRYAQAQFLKDEEGQRKATR